MRKGKITMKKMMLYAIALMMCIAMTGCASDTKKEEKPVEKPEKQEEQNTKQTQDDDWNTMMNAIEAVRNKKDLHVIDFKIEPSHMDFYTEKNEITGAISKEKMVIDINNQEGTIKDALSVRNMGEKDDYEDTIGENYDRVLYLKGDEITVEGEPVYCESCEASTLYDSTNKTMRITKNDQGGDIQKYKKLFDYPNQLADVLYSYLYVAGIDFSNGIPQTEKDIPAKDYMNVKKEEKDDGITYILTSKNKIEHYENVNELLFMNQNHPCDREEEHHIRLNKKGELTEYKLIYRYTFTEANKDFSYIHTITFLD